MSGSGGRNPKDLRQIVAASKKDVCDMQSNLAKLKALSEDDKSENNLLRSRIEDQSSLIMILKQRADEATISAQTLERINKELVAFRDHAEEELNTQLKKYNMLDARFYDLAHNHQEMIKFKDEYKRQNEALRAENQRLKDENERLFSEAILEKDEQIRQFKEKTESLTNRCMSAESQHRETERLLKEAQEIHREEVRTLRQKLNESQEKIQNMISKLKQQANNQTSANEEAQNSLLKLKKEKDELLELSMKRGRLIHDKETQNNKMQQKVIAMEKHVKEMEDKFKRDAESVNINLQVRRLRSDLEEAELRYEEAIREFEAFKKHSGNLLQQEKELNARLRHVMS